jgi:hypothetical protein
MDFMAIQAVETILIIDKMNSGHLSPRSLETLIDPLEIEFYQERMAFYLSCLASPDAARKRIPLPILYELACERLWCSLNQKAPQEIGLSEKQSATIVDIGIPKTGLSA